MGETISAIYVKAGGSFITFKDRVFSVNYRALESLGKILSRVMGEAGIILGNGGGSFAHPVVEALRGNGAGELLVHCQRATRKLNSIVVDYLVDNGVPAVSVQTSAIMVEGGGVFTEPLKEALRRELIPVVYGECIYSERDGYSVVSTEDVFTLLADHIRPVRMVLLMSVDGVYSCDPSSCGSPELIPLINRDNYDRVTRMLSGAGGIDVTGGIKIKVEKMMRLSEKHGIPVYLVSGFNVDDAVAAIRGEMIGRGTVIRGF